MEKNDRIDFSDEICDLVVKLTEGFSFAYLQELLVQTLLIMARTKQVTTQMPSDFVPESALNTPLTSILREQATLLRKDMEDDTEADTDHQSDDHSAEKSVTQRYSASAMVG